MSKFDDNWNKTNADIQSVFDLFDDTPTTKAPAMEGREGAGLSYNINKDDFFFYELKDGNLAPNENLFAQTAANYGITGDDAKELRKLAGTMNQATMNNDTEVADATWEEICNFVNTHKKDLSNEEKSAPGTAFDENFDINNPEKEVREFEAAAKRFKEACNKCRPLEKQHNEYSARMEELGMEYDAAQKAGDKVRAEKVLDEWAEIAYKDEELYPQLVEAREEARLAKEALDKEGAESHLAAETDYKKTGDDKWIRNDNDIANSIRNYVTEYEELEKMAKDSEAKLKNAEAAFKEGLSKTEREMGSAGQQLMNGANAAMDPNGAGGVRVAEAAAMMALSLGKAAKGSVSTIKNFFAKRNEKKGLSSILDKQKGVRDEAALNGIHIHKKEGYTADYTVEENEHDER